MLLNRWTLPEGEEVFLLFSPFGREREIEV